VGGVLRGAAKSARPRSRSISAGYQETGGEPVKDEQPGKDLDLKRDPGFPNVLMESNRRPLRQLIVHGLNGVETRRGEVPSHPIESV
jgi:hypothetical protein